MSYFERYEQWRDKMYGGPKYTPDAYLGAALNDTEKRMVEETLPEGYQANLRSLGSVFVPEENRYVQKLELNLSPEEQGTWKRSNMVIGDHMGQLHFSDPLVEAYAQVAYNRANMQLASWRQGPVLPEVEDIWSKYPGVDPLGKHCDKDMEFASRLETIKLAAQYADPQRKAALDRAFEMIQEPNGNLEVAVRESEYVFKSVRETKRAAKLCPNEQVSQLLEQGAQKHMEESECVKKLDDFYTALEHMAGLRQESPSAEVLRSAQQFHLDTELVAKPGTLNMPKNVAIDMPNLENIALQSSFSHPANWGKTPARLAELLQDPVKVSGCVDKYAQTVGKRTVDHIFGSSSQKIAAANNMDRAGLIVIDGKTVAERMREEYGQGLGKPPYDQWFAKESREKTAQYLSGALMAGRRVEIYPPKADGTLAEDPVRLTAKGYAPAPEKPTLLNAWERFWNQFGFYKDKAAQAKADQESMEAKKRVHTNYATARLQQSMDRDNLTDMFFKDYLQEKGFESVDEFGRSLAPNSTGGRLSYDRSAFQSICVGIMASQDVPLEDIMDPTKMRQEKQLVGRMLMERLAYNPQNGREGIVTQVYDRTINTRTGDGEWLGKMAFAGQQGLMRQINKMMHGVDLNNELQVQRVLPALNLASGALFDIRQEVERGTDFKQNTWVTETFQSYADQVGANAPVEQRLAIAKAYNDKATLVANAGLGIARDHYARQQIDREGHTRRTMGDALGHIVTGEVVKKTMLNNQGRCFTERVPDDHIYSAVRGGIAMLLPGDQPLGQLAEAALNDPKVRKNLGAMAKDGKLGPAMDVKIVRVPEGFDALSVTPADKLLKTAAKTAPKMTMR